MKKCFKLFAAALMASAMVVPAQADEILTICDGGRTSSYIPFKPTDFIDEGMHSQLIYPAELISAMSGEQLNSITFYLQDGMYASGGQLLVKMGETDRMSYSSAADFRSDLVEVVAMPLTEGVTEFVIEFSNPYIYQGGNLVIDFTNPEVGDDNYYAWNHWYGESMTYYSAIGSNGAMDMFLPKASFDYGVPQEWDASVSPLALDFNIPAEREAVQTITIRNKGLNAFIPVISTLSAPLSVEAEPVELATGETLEIAVKFAPAEVINTTAVLTIDCGEAGTFEVNINAVATEPVYEVVAADGSDTNAYMPIFGYYYDTAGTMSQMIYTEEMMGATKGNKITKVTFYPTSSLGFTGGKLQLSFKTVEESEFAEATAITDMTVVATVTPGVGDTELVFVLDEPFEYNGGNLAIEANVIESANYKSTYFYGKNYDYKPSFYHYVNMSNETINALTSFLPKVTFTYDKNNNPQPEYTRGDVNDDQAINITDVTALINYLLTEDATGVNLDAANCNQDETINITDVTVLINFLLTDSWD